MLIKRLLGRNSSKSIDRVLDDYGAYEAIDMIVQQLARHPFLAFGMSICILAMTLPFIIFMIFAITTVIMTFTGFVIIEGRSEWLRIDFERVWPQEIPCRHTNYYRISSTFWLPRWSHPVFCIPRFDLLGWLLWSFTHLRVLRLSEEASSRRRPHPISRSAC